MANKLALTSVMPATIACHGMSRMLMAVISDLNLHGLQHVQLRTYLLHAIHTGKTFLNGLTVTCAYTPAAT